jgi:type II secretory ATPase GspE/PulE/Tfp pilus assembly ATPase PilB-like protein
VARVVLSDPEIFGDPRTGRSSDVRAFFYVTIFGEKIVLRLLNRKAELLDIKDIGLTPRMRERSLSILPRSACAKSHLKI